MVDPSAPAEWLGLFVSNINETLSVLISSSFGTRCRRCRVVAKSRDGVAGKFIQVVFHVGVPIGREGRAVTNVTGIKSVGDFPCIGHPVMVRVGRRCGRADAPLEMRFGHVAQTGRVT